MTKFKVGDTIYYVKPERRTKWVKCPDCFEEKYLKVLLADGTEHTIDCAGCTSGYGSPSGVVEAYEWGCSISKALIGGIEIKGKNVEYKINVVGDINGGCSYNTIKEDVVFASEAEALPAIEVEKSRLAELEENRIQSKERPSRTWAWHVHYYRRQIRDAERQIQIATERLNAAKKHVKEPAVVGAEAPHE